MEKELWICFTQRETQVPLPTWPLRWVGFWAPLDCWQAEVSAPCVVSAKTGLPAGMVSLLLIWAFLVFSHSFMGREHLSSPHFSLHCCKWGHTASYVFWLTWNSYCPKGFPPVLCPSFYVAMQYELLLKETFLFQAVGVCWLWASLYIKLKRPVHNSRASHWKGLGCLGCWSSLHLLVLCTLPRASLHLNVLCGMPLGWEFWPPGNCSVHLALRFWEPPMLVGEDLASNLALIALAQEIFYGIFQKKKKTHLKWQRQTFF